MVSHISSSLLFLLYCFFLVGGRCESDFAAAFFLQTENKLKLNQHKMNLFEANT